MKKDTKKELAFWATLINSGLGLVLAASTIYLLWKPVFKPVHLILTSLGKQLTELNF